VALYDLEDDRVHRILRPNPLVGKGGRAAPSHIWVARAHVAIAIAALIKSGMGREAAANKVGKFSALAGLATNKKSKSLQSAALSWDTEFRGKRIKNRIAAATYAELQSKLDVIIALNRDDPAERLRGAAHGALQLAAKIGLGT
jgi:hypothetical protein